MKGQNLEIRLVAAKDPRFQKLRQEYERDCKSRFANLAAKYEQMCSAENLEQSCVLFSAGQPIACGGFEPMDEETAQLKLVYVRPEQRRKGYAGQMIETLELQAMFQGYMRMVLVLPRKAPEATLFRRALGYQEAKPWGAFVGDGALICLEKELMD